MISLAEALEFVHSKCAALPNAVVPIDDALGLFTASPIKASDDLPPFDNSAMDGFAVRAADLSTAPVTLDIVGTVSAGAATEVELKPGQALRIMTGAPMPTGADSIVMVELADVSSDGSTVTFAHPVELGNHVRAAGDDISRGDAVIAAGTKLTPSLLGLTCSLGSFDVAAVRRPRIGVLSTGDELVDSARPLARGEIRDSNRHALLGLVASTSATPVDLGIVPDDEEMIRQHLISASAQNDAIVTSGGVSMGDFDFVKKVLSEIGDMRWMQIAIKPAKPFAFGTIAGTPVFGLPGNPVSSIVSFELLARPGIRALMGDPSPATPTIHAFAGHDLRRREDGKTHFVRVVLSQDPDGKTIATSAGHQGSHQMSAMLSANGLAIVPNGSGLVAGEPVDVIAM